jgi:hypothetical protein
MTSWETAWVITSVISALVFGRSVLIWGTLTYLMGWPVFLVLVAFGAKPKAWERRGERLQSLLDKLDEKSKPKEYKDFNSVDDLFKQLESK